jgi:serine/threonine-protein kinase
MAADFPFRLLKEVGSGSSGRVWQAQALEDLPGAPTGALLAVKLLHPHLRHDAQALRNFECEARAGMEVDHPAVVRVHAAGASDEGRWLAMRWMGGPTLRMVLAEDGAALAEPRVRALLRRAAEGLAALHAKGWTHGDLKPENIRLDEHGEAVLLDLGFARRDGDDEATEPRPGSLAYLAPEQARGERGSREADVFALCVVAYELATGAHPFLRAAQGAQAAGRGGESALFDSLGSSGAVARAALEKPTADRVLAAIVAARCPPPSRLAPQLSPFFDRLVADGLAREASRRPSAGELARRLLEGEAGAWWRATVDLASAAGRGAAAEAEGGEKAPLVGREAALERLEEAWSAGTGGLRALFVSGEAGMGKTRLVSEFVARLRERLDAPLCLYARCRDAEDSRAAQPLVRLLERWLRLPSGARPTAREREELERLLPPRATSTLLRLLGGEDAEVGEMSPSVALAQWLSALSREVALLVHLDDAHRAGRDTWDALEAWAREGGGARRALLVACARGEAKERGGWQRLETLAPCQELELAPLSEDDVLLLVKRLFHHGAPRLRLASVLWRRSRGNPGLVVELLRGLVARGEARPHPDGGGLELGVDPDALPLPRSIKQAIEESYRALPTLDRAWLRRLAVVGGRIEPDFLLACFKGTSRTELDELLGRFVKLGWLVVAGARYRFARPALREALYRSLSKEQRERLHGAAADALSEERASLEGAYQRAFHLRCAGRHAELLAELPPLMDALVRHGQPQRVAPLAGFGLEALDQAGASAVADRLKIRLLEAAADATDRLGSREDQRDLLERLSNLEIDSTADPEAAGRVYLLHGRYAVATGQYGLARGLYKNAIELLDRAGARLESSEALRRLSAVQSHVGRLVEARGLAEEALRQATNDAQRGLALLQLATVGVLEDQLEQALEQTEQALKLLRGDGRWHLPGAVAGAHLVRSRIQKGAGDIARALAAARRALDLARAAGESRLECEALARLGGLLLDIDRPDEAQSMLREALLRAKEIEDPRGTVLATLFLGILLWEADDPAAQRTLEDAAQLASDLGLSRIEQLADALRARIEHAAGRLEAALELSARAVAALERHGAEWNDRVVVVATRAMCLRSAGRTKEADALELSLRRQLERENKALTSPAMRLRHRRRGEALVAAAASPEGPVYPRVRLDE